MSKKMKEELAQYQSAYEDLIKNGKDENDPALKLIKDLIALKTKESGQAFEKKIDYLDLQIGVPMSEINLSIYGQSWDKIKEVLKNAGMKYLPGRDTFAPSSVKKSAGEGWELLREKSTVTLLKRPEKKS